MMFAHDACSQCIYVGSDNVNWLDVWYCKDENCFMVRYSDNPEDCHRYCPDRAFDMFNLQERFTCCYHIAMVFMLNDYTHSR